MSLRKEDTNKEIINKTLKFIYTEVFDVKYDQSIATLNFAIDRFTSVISISHFNDRDPHSLPRKNIKYKLNNLNLWIFTTKTLRALI